MSLPLRCRAAPLRSAMPATAEMAATLLAVTPRHYLLRYATARARRCRVRHMAPSMRYARQQRYYDDGAATTSIEIRWRVMRVF